MGARLELEILDCNDPPANVKPLKNPSSCQDCRRNWLGEATSSELSKGVEFPSLLPFRVCGYRKNPTGVAVSNLPELCQRLSWCPIGERKPWVKYWRKSPHTTKLLKLLRAPY